MKNGTNGHAVHAESLLEGKMTAEYYRGFIDGMRRACRLLVAPITARLSEKDQLELSKSVDNVERLLHEAEQRVGK